MGLLRLGYALAFLFVLLCAGVYASPATQPEISDCNALIDKEVPEVGAAYRKAAAKGVITNNHKCLLEDVHNVNDIGELLESIPENTVVFIVNREPDNFSPTGTDVIQLYNERNKQSSFPDVDLKSHLLSISFRSLMSNQSEPLSGLTLNGVIQIEQSHGATPCVPSKTAVHMKKGTVLLGVDGHTRSYIPVCEAEQPGHIRSMFEVGENDRFEDVGKLYISGFNFLPSHNNTPDPADSIWRVRCYTGSIYFENNYFRLETRSSIYLQCIHSTTKHIHFGFHNNAVIGMGKADSNEGLLVDFRNLVDDNPALSTGIFRHSYLKRDLFGRYLADISGNWFSGTIKSAIKMRLDNGCAVKIENNHIRPAVKQFSKAQYGLVLHGPFLRHRLARKVSRNPKFILNNNFLETQKNALEVFGKLDISMAGNYLSALQPIGVLDLTDDHVHTAVKLTSPQPNYWMDNIDTCPDHYSGHGSFTGYFHLVTMPGNRECNWSGIGTLHDGGL